MTRGGEGLGEGSHGTWGVDNRLNVSAQCNTVAKGANAILGCPDGHREVLLPGTGVAATGLLCPVLVPQCRDAGPLVRVRGEPREWWKDPKSKELELFSVPKGRGQGSGAQAGLLGLATEVRCDGM